MKIAFVHIPKTAGGSIFHWFKGHVPNTMVKNGHCLLKDIPGPYDYSFCVVRNTYYRLISLYEFSKYQNPRKLQRRIKKGNIDSCGIKRMQISKEYLDKGIIPWLEYQIEQQSSATLSLLDWINGVNIVLHQETLQSDFLKIQKLTNCFEPLQKNKHVLKYNPNVYLDKKYINFVYKNYKDEIEHFNYKV